ncbi:hypothetical protein [Bacillus sp. FJAT-28004]|uniref:hypothetical protein n=1 Tax=Bacillus sp. FJAT-28004 TaxID=1679165 RepID=UPI0006B4BB02|nr:hypothetical protein [Bacillus sp. FJAT-28004]
MLDDAARKVLTVMWNVYRNDPSKIDVDIISRRAQRTEEQVKAAINKLVKEGFVLWDIKANAFNVLYNREAAKPVMPRGWNL